jgi:hypothetical protein
MINSLVSRLIVSAVRVGLTTLIPRGSLRFAQRHSLPRTIFPANKRRRFSSQAFCDGTTTMAIRVALLILVTGAFVALWSGDHPERTARGNSPRSIRREIRPLSPTPNHDSLSRVNTTGAHPVQLTTAANLGSVPLPDGIAAGTYLIVDQLGRTQLRVIATSDSANHPEQQNVYSTSFGGTRIHFIRVEQPAERHATAADSPVTSR